MDQVEADKRALADRALLLQEVLTDQIMGAFQGAEGTLREKFNHPAGADDLEDGLHLLDKVRASTLLRLNRATEDVLIMIGDTAR